MDNDLGDGQWASNHDNTVFLTSNSPVNGTDAEPGRLAAKQADPPSGDQVDKHNPVCMPYVWNETAFDSGPSTD